MISILHIVPGLGGGGTERQLMYLVRGLDRIRFAVRVVSFAGGENQPQLELLGVPAANLQLRQPLLHCRNLPAMLRLAEQLRRRPPDLIHSWLFHANIVAALGAWWSRVPALVLAERNLGYALRAGHRQVARRLYRRATAVVANSAAVAQVLREGELASPQQLRVIPNGVPLPTLVQSPLTGEERAKVCARFGLPASGKLVVAVGRLAKVKGHGHLIAAAGKLAPRFPQTTFVVVGAGSEGPRLQQQAREIGVAQQVHWLGHQPDVTPLLAVADVFVLPSLSEGMSNALMEAMAAGCPVVATDVGSNSELLQHGRAGRLVRGGDEAGLVDAMGELLADPKAAQALGREARAAIAPFSVGRMVQQYEELYEEIAIAKRQ